MPDQRGHGASGRSKQSKRIKDVKKTGTLYYLIGLVSCLLILLPPILALLYVRAFGVSVIFPDAWSMAPLLREASKKGASRLTLGSGG